MKCRAIQYPKEQIDKIEYPVTEENKQQKNRLLKEVVETNVIIEIGLYYLFNQREKEMVIITLRNNFR
jgi:hypothetical protein